VLTASESNICPAGTYSAAEGASECTACPAGSYGFGAPYTCGDSATCKNVARSCGSGSDACSTSQSSTAWNGPSNLAVDGNTNAAYAGGSCTHTDLDNTPWWTVDFGTMRNIVMVSLYLRGDGGHAQALDGFEIRLGGSATWQNNPICSYGNSVLSTLEITVPCKGRGRWLTISVPTTTYMNLCEVYVWGPQPGWDWDGMCNNCPAGAHSAAAGAPPRLRPLRYMRLEA